MSALIKKAIPLSFLLSVCMVLQAQRNYPPNIEGSIPEVYKTIGEAELKVWIFNPPQHNVDSKAPAIVFFFGGGWRGGTPTQFVPHCEYLAARGMVAMVADYRVSSRHGVKAFNCVEDAKSAIRWMRKNADRLGIYPDRIVAGGGSAGGHLAAATATIAEFNDAQDDQSTSAQPNATALFNPVVLLAGIKDRAMSEVRNKALEERAGVEPVKISPYHHIKVGMGPSIIFHGTGDKTVTHESVVLYRDKMTEKGNRCELYSYEGEGHGFFNFGRNGNGAFIDTVNRLDAFLVSLGYIPAPPVVLDK